MTKKAYDWLNGAVLEDHTRKKHAVLRRYLREYLVTRCQIPQQERFRLIVVEGFAGGGIYSDGSYGSPIIIADELAKSTKEINSRREIQGLRPVAVACLLILNDADAAVVNQLRGNIERVLGNLRAETPHLEIATEYYSEEFEPLYARLVHRIDVARCRNVIFNLDQCGYRSVTGQIIADTMTRWRSAEVFLTFAIESLLAFLSPGNGYNNLAYDPELEAQIRTLRADSAQLLTKKEWLGTAERAVHAYFRRCAPYVSPFSINNPAGWRYWLMHFANSHRARQVYNDILHKDDAVQAHFGRAGLHMLSYDPCNEGQLYLFDASSRERAKEALITEIPSLVAEFGDSISMDEFYANAYSATPAHTDDIHEVIIANPDIEVITESGGKRRRPGTIRQSDTLKLTHQRSLFFTFPRKGTDPSS
jgi:three-Cys-motif partner protein